MSTLKLLRSKVLNREKLLQVEETRVRKAARRGKRNR
jgi:hypothetical protein